MAAKRKTYLLVDGYNIIFAWDELNKIAQDSLSDARDKLIFMLQNFVGYRDYEVILVFDAHKTNGTGSYTKAENITVVYTMEAVTADEYIEKTVAMLNKRDRIFVATSDALEQVIIMALGAQRLSATDLFGMVDATNKRITEEIGRKPVKKNQLIDILDEEAAKLFEELRLK